MLFAASSSSHQTILPRSNGIMNESSTTAKSARLNGNSNTAKAKPASEFDEYAQGHRGHADEHATTETTASCFSLRMHTHSSSPQRVMFQRQRPHPLPRRRQH